MQTLRKPSRRERKEAEGSRHRRILGGVNPFNAILSVAVFALFAWFVNSLEGLDGDTVFIALFCTLLTMFIFKALEAALSRRREEQ